VPLKLNMHDAPLLMGIVNVTPDSFSDGGMFANHDRAYDHAMALFDDGADILDIGGESTRPDAEPVEPQMELDRVLPVIERIAANSDAVISIDTRHAKTMTAALKTGARIVNDVTALRSDKGAIEAAKQAEYICLMHMQGNPKTMQKKPFYNNVVEDVFAFFQERISFCDTHGIDKNKLILDVGIGFGKGLEHNIALLKHMHKFHELDCPLLLGTSRKSFIEKIMNETTPVSDRLGGSLATVIDGYQKGVQIFRVHDVFETKQALDIFKRINY